MKCYVLIMQKALLSITTPKQVNGYKIRDFKQAFYPMGLDF